MNELFPIFLKANQINMLIIGGGKVAQEKLFFLQKSSPLAKITLVAKEINEEVYSILLQFPRPTIYNRSFTIEDIADKHIVIAATNNHPLNIELRYLADKYHFLLNVADKPEFCDFYLGGVVTKGDLKLAISTNGKSPILAKRLRETFEEILPPSLEKTISSTHELRKKLHGNFDDKLKKLNALTQELITK